MKPSYIYIVLGLGFFLLQCKPKQELDLPKHYEARFSEHELTIDGKLDEPIWKSATWSDKFVDIEGFDKPVPKQETQMKMAWDDRYLYIAARLMEEHLWATLTEKDAIVFHDNDFEVFIDPDGDGLNYYEFEINAWGTVFDLFMDKPYKKGGKADIPWDFQGLKTAIHLDGTLNDPRDTDSHWVVEMAIPWNAFSANPGIAPANNDMWRINFSRVQWDLNIMNESYQKIDKPEYNWVWSPQGEINMHIPEKWGYVQFTGQSEN